MARATFGPSLNLPMILGGILVYTLLVIAAVAFTA